MEEVVIYNVRDNEAFCWAPERNIEVYIGAKAFRNETDLRLRNVIPGTQAQVEIDSFAQERNEVITKYRATKCIYSQNLSPLVISGFAKVVNVNPNYIIIEDGSGKCYFAPGWTTHDVPASSLAKKKVHFLALPKRKEAKSHCFAFCVHAVTSTCEDVRHLSTSWASHWYNKTNLPKPLADDPFPNTQHFPLTIQSHHANDTVGNGNRFDALFDTSCASSSSSTPLPISATQSDNEKHDNNELPVAAYDIDELERDIEEGILEEGIVFFQNYPARTGKIFIPSLGQAVPFMEEFLEGGRYDQIILGDRVKFDRERLRVILGLERSFYATEGSGIVHRVEKGHCVVRVKTPETWKGKSVLAPGLSFQNTTLCLEPALVDKNVNFLALPSNPNPKYAESPMIFSIY